MKSVPRALKLASLLPVLVLALAATRTSLAEETPEELMRRAQQESYQGKVDDGIKLLEGYLADHPKGEHRGRMRIVLGEMYQRASRTDDAKAIFRKAIDEDEDVAPEAGWRFMGAMGCGFYMWSNRTWGPGDTPEIGLNVWINEATKHPDTIPFELWKLDAEKLQADWAAKPRSLEELLTAPPKGAGTKIASWDVDWPKEGGGEPVKLKDAKTTGIYLVVAKPFGIPFRMPVVVAGHSIVVRRSATGTLVFAADRLTGAPIDGLELFTFESKPVSLGKTGKDGCWEGELAGNGEIAAWSGGSLAASHSWWWGARAGSLVTHFSTDRPIYRPGHTVHWKAIVRALGPSGEYALPEKKKVHLIVRDPNGAEVWKGDAEPNAYGTFTGEVVLKEGCPLGHWTIDLGTGAWGQFRVEEYRKPEFQVKVEAPTFCIQGDSFTAKVSAKYYFGAPVTKGQVIWEVFRRPHWRPWWTLFPCSDSWFFEEEGYGYGWYGSGNLVKQGTGEISKDGTFEVEVPVDRNEDPNMRWQDEAITVVARVQDASRREESGSSETLAPRASFSLYAQTDRWVYRPGDEVALTVRALDPENKPVANVAISTHAVIREWQEHGWKSSKEVGSFTGTTDASGNAIIKMSPDARGSLEVTVTAKDEKGRSVETQSWIWLADEMWVSPVRSTLECTADKRSYEVGDLATILCTMPQEKGTALVTREREGIFTHEVTSFEKGVLLVKTKVEDRDMPNVFVTVTTVSSGLHQGAAELIVIPEKRLLDVSVSFDKEKYQPREKAVVKVKAVDRATRKPVKAEVALGVVDASLYALATDPAVDIRKFFYKRRPHAVQTSSSFEWWVSGRAGANAMEAQDAAKSAPAGAPAPPAAARAMKKAGKDDESSLVEAQVRKDFPDTWIWQGTLETDSNGEASVELTVPDSLTTWRATARAITQETAVGSATSEATVFLPVLVRTEAPRFLVQGDVGGISALVHNYLEKGKKTKLSWSATGPVTLGKPTITGGEVIELSDSSAWVAIPSLGEVRLDWFEAKALKPGKVELEVKAQTDEASDAMRTPAFPVIAHGAPRYTSWAGSLDEKDAETITLTIQDGAIPEAVELDLSMTPSVAATMLDTLESLAGYPYGCVEQTMSRFLPDVVALDALRKLSQDDEKLRAELPKMIAAGLDRLRGFQHPDGGWGWWEHDETHPYMTAYVVYGLALARQADVKVDDSMYARGVAALEKLLEGKAKLAHAEDKEDANARAYMLFALSQTKKVGKKAFAKVDREKLNSYGKAVLARALFKSGKADEAREIAKELVAAAKTTGSTCSWDVDAANHGWMSLDTETTAQALHALEEIGEGKDLWAKTVKWLIVHRRGHWWYSTKDSAMVVYVLAEHMVRTNELEADEDLTISIGEKELVRQHVDKTNVLATRVGLKLGLSDLGSARTVTFKRSGKGGAYFAANLRTTAFEEDMKASDGAITCDRQIEVYHRDKDGTEKHFALGKDAVQVGDELHVTLTIQAGDVREYLLVEDPIPAGCEFVREDLSGEQGGRERGGARRWEPWMWSYWYCHREYRDDRLAVCSTYVWAHQNYKVEYVLRCERPGDFHVLPTRALDMYNPDVGGTGAENRLSVR